MEAEYNEDPSFLKSDKSNHILLIDLENCPNQIHQLMRNLEQYSYVTVCYAQSGAKVPLDWILPLTKTVNENRLKIIKMPSGGKNAADFGITFWAGFQMSQLPSATHFTIVSNDSDLDHVVNLLISEQRSAERIGNKKEIIGHQPTDTCAPVISDENRRLQEYCLHLVNHSKSRPAKKQTLINNIKSKFKDDGILSEQLFNVLSKQSVIVIKDGNKISYNEPKIAKLANA